MIILHCTSKSDLKSFRESGSYGEHYMKSCGFIHCSPPDLMVSVANANYKHEDDLVLLCIDTEKLHSEVKWEDLEGSGGIFPHIYGLLTIDAVVDVFEFERDSENNFLLPAGVDKYR